MKLRKKKKPKYILVKRKFFSLGTYDYIWKIKEEGEHIIESTRDVNNRDFQFVRAEKSIELWFRVKKFLKNKNIQKITWMIIGMLISILGTNFTRLIRFLKNLINHLFNSA